MAKIKSVKYNFIMNVILTCSSFIFPMITFPYASRVLLPEGVGKVNFATSIVNYFTMFAMLGVPTYGIRACAQVRDDREKLTKTVWEILWINFLCGVFCYVLYFLAIWYVPRLKEEFSLYLIINFSIIFNIIGVEWLYKGLEQYSYITFRSIIFKVIALVLMFLFVRTPQDYVIYGGISIFAVVGSNFLNFFNLRRYIDLRPVGRYNLKKHMKPIVVFFLMSVATTIYTNLDVVMLGFMQGDIEVGYYSASVKIKNIFVSCVTALSAVLMPRVSYYIENKKMEEFQKASNKALNFVLALSIPLIVYFTIYAEESVFLLSGEAFAGAVVPMQIIMPTVLLIGLTNVLGIQVLVPLNKEILVVYSVVIGAIVDLCINIVCIPTMGASGAALGTLVAELVVLIVQIFFLREQIKCFIEGIQWYKIILASGFAGFICVWIKKIEFSNMTALVFSALIFGIIYGGSLLISKESLVYGLLSELIKKMKNNRI